VGVVVQDLVDDDVGHHGDHDGGGVGRQLCATTPRPTRQNPNLAFLLPVLGFLLIRSLDALVG
jgi:hypothetical protein